MERTSGLPQFSIIESLPLVVDINPSASPSSQSPSPSPSSSSPSSSPASLTSSSSTKPLNDSGLTIHSPPRLIADWGDSESDSVDGSIDSSTSRNKDWPEPCVDLRRRGFSGWPAEALALSVEGRPPATVVLSNNGVGSVAPGDLSGLCAVAPDLQGSLLWLDLSRNQLAFLSHEIGLFRQLQRLELQRNKLTSLPAAL